MKVLRRFHRYASGRGMTLTEVEDFCREARSQGYSDESTLWATAWSRVRDRDLHLETGAIEGLAVNERGKSYEVSK